MTRNKLIQAVALRMDEITPLEAITDVTVTIDGSDNNPLYTLIDGVVDDGVLELFSVAPYWRLKQVKFETTDMALATEGGRKILRIKIGENFLRVAEILCDAFQRPITTVFPEESPEGRRQHNKYLRAGSAKPVGVMSHGEWSSEQVREIDCYSLPSDFVITSPTTDVPPVTVYHVQASYIAKPSAIATTGATAVEAVVPAALIPCLEWMVASLAFTARGDSNHAALCNQNAQNLLI